MRRKVVGLAGSLLQLKHCPARSPTLSAPRNVFRRYSARTLQVAVEDIPPAAFYQQSYFPGSIQHGEISTCFSQALEVARESDSALKHDLATLLSLLPESAFEQEETGVWPTEMMQACIHAREVDTASIIKLLPIVKDYVENTSTEEGEYVLRGYLSRIRSLRMLVLIPHVTDMFLNKLEQEKVMRMMDANEVQWLVNGYLGALKDFRHFSTIPSTPNKAAKSRKLPLIVSQQVERVTAYLFDYIDRLPSTSETPIRIGRRLRRTLFSKYIITPTLRSLLLDHIPLEDLFPKEWNICIASAAAEGNVDLMMAFEDRRKDMEQESQSRKVMTARRTESFADSHDETWERLEDPSMEETIFEGSTLVNPNEASAAAIEEKQEIERSLRTIQAYFGLDSDALGIAPRERRSGSQHGLQRILDKRVSLHLGTAYDQLELYLRADGIMTPEAEATRLYAWSVFLSKLSRERNVGADDLMDVYEDLTDDLMIPQVLTPIMTGLESRHYHQAGWEIWRDLVFREKGERKRENPARKTKKISQFVDRQALAVATRLYGELDGLEGALEMVDSWAERMSPPLTDNNTDTTRWRNSVVIDDYNINELLAVCRKSCRPDVALKIFLGSSARWGAKPDGVSLTLFIDVCRFTATREEESPSVSGRFRDLLNHFRSRSSANTEYEPAKTIGTLDDDNELSQGDHEVFLDVSDSKRYWGNLKPWEYARNLFREIMMTNWPCLRYVKSPLSLKGPFTSLQDILNSTSLPDDLDVNLQYPSISAKYTHIIPNSGTFQSYIVLLGFFKLHEEIPIVLAWAKELGIQPNTKTLCSALAFICEAEGPRRLIRGWREVSGGSKLVRDEEILRRWLESWIVGHVPTEDEVTNFIRTTRGSESGSLVSR